MGKPADALINAEHDCRWCGKSISRQEIFCCERCRHEYNTAKGTNYDKLDYKYIAQIQRQEEVDSANQTIGILGCWVPGILFFLVMCANPMVVLKNVSLHFGALCIVYLIYIFITSAIFGPPADKSTK